MFLVTWFKGSAFKGSDFWVQSSKVPRFRVKSEFKG
jgi:hypothetical protein